MNKIVYKKFQKKNYKKYIRVFGLFLSFVGFSIVVYVFAPLILWQLLVAPAIAAQQLAIPIPQKTLVTPVVIQSLLKSEFSALSGTDYSNAKNWFPTYSGPYYKAKVASYSITIPKLHIQDALVSAVDDDLSKHLVNFEGTCTPPDKGNCVIFGHSTLPQLYDPKNYKTIFANIQNLQIGDTFTVNVENILYTYKIFSMTIVDPEDTSVLAQTTDDSYITIITCTPPGTVWKRLVIKARLETLK